MRKFQLHLKITQENIIKTQFYVALLQDPHLVIYIVNFPMYIVLTLVCKSCGDPEGDGAEGPDPLKILSLLINLKKNTHTKTL